MVRLARKNARANATRFVLTQLAIMVSVAFLTATLVLSDSMAGSAAADIARANASVDAVVQGGLIAEGGGGPGEIEPDIRKALTPEEISIVESTPGVASIAPVTVGFAKVVAGGSSVSSGVASDIGMAWIDDDRVNPFALSEGTAPIGAQEVAIDEALAKAGGIQVGESIEVLTATGVLNATVTGLVTYGGNERAPAQRVTLMAAEHAAVLLASGEPSELRLLFDDLANPQEVVTELSNALSKSDATVVAGATYVADQQNAVTAPMSFLSSFLLAFAAIATIVGVSMIYNTFAIAMAQRRREFALLRAIGAERRQVLRSVLAEAILMGLSATIAGTVLGIAGVGLIRSLMTNLGLTFLSGPTVVSSTTLGVAGFVGLAVTTSSCWFPARSAAATPAIAALSDSAVEVPVAGRVRSIIGHLLLGVGLVGTCFAAVSGSGVLLSSLVLVVVGLGVSGPSLISGLSKVARPVLRRMFGMQGGLAATNLGRNPKRSSSTTLSLTLGVALVSFFTILASSFGASIASGLDRTVKADWVINSVSPDFPSVDPTLAERLNRIPGVAAVAPMALTDVLVNGSEQTIAGIDPSAMPAMFDFGETTGHFPDLETGGIAVVVDAELLPESELDAGEVAPSIELGDQLEVQFEETVLHLRVVAIVTNSLGGFDMPTMFVSPETLHVGSQGLLDTSVFVMASEPEDLTATGALLQDVVDQSPGALFETRESYIANAGSEVDSFRNFIYALLGLTIIIALIGIANTTMLAIGERVREIGLLRAVGMTSAGIRRVIMYETAVLTLAGALSGTALAVVAGWALISAVGGADLPNVVVPWRSLLVVAGGSVAVALLLAFTPAWSASRKPILAALAGR